MLFDLRFTVNGYEIKLTGDTVSIEEVTANVIKIMNAMKSLPPAETKATATATATETKTIAVEMVSRSHDGTKEVVRVHGAPYAKYGVAVYPDSCKEGYHLIPAGYGQHLMTGYEAVVAMNGDKPSRVIAIRPATMPF